MRASKGFCLLGTIGLALILSSGCSSDSTTLHLGHSDAGATGGGGDTSSGGLGMTGTGGMNQTAGGAGGGLGNGGGGSGAPNGGRAGSPDASSSGGLDGGPTTDGGGDGATSQQCRSNADCAGATDGKRLCDAPSGECVACHTNIDCQAKEECTAGACTPLKTCKNSIACAGAPDGKTICDVSAGVCVECTIDGDCGTAKKTCAGRTCHTTCTSDNQCTGQGLLCNQALGGICTACVRAADCTAKQYCDVGSCVPDTCIAGQKSCQKNTLVQCNADGSAVVVGTACTGQAVCVETSGSATCEAPPKTDAGTPPPKDAGLGNCGNKVKDGSETAVDCGGPDCAPCRNGAVCKVAADCQSDVCARCNTSPLCVLQLTCQAPTCADGVMNGTETGVDCGGTAGTRGCPRCGGGEGCKAGTDCASGTCTSGKCTAPKCTVASCPTCFSVPASTKCCTPADACGCQSIFGGACQ